MDGDLENICEIKKSDQLGRYLVAKRAINPGELIFAEEPTIVGPYWDADISCLNCLRSASKMCKTCLKAPLCRVCSTHDAIECDFFQQATNFNKNFLIDHFNTVTPIRCLLLYRKDRAKFHQIMQLESHFENRKGTEIWNIHQQYVVNPLIGEGAFHTVDDLLITEDLLQQICGILDVNTFEIRGNIDSQGVQMNNLARGLYPCTSLMTHNCQTNTLIAVDSNSKLRLYASVTINAGDLLYYNYTRVLFNTFERQTHLQKGKYFVCSCSRCTDPTENGTHLSSIKCTECEKGLCLFYDEVPKWECNLCGYQMPRSYVNQVMCNAREDLSCCGMDIRNLEKFVVKHSKTLNPHHSLVLEAKQLLAAELRSLSMSYESHNVPRHIMTRRFELCEEMLQILRILDPGISRLTGIALYEYQAALVELSRRNHDTGETTTLAFLENLQTAEKTLKEAIGMLLFEHTTTPEGQLTKRALFELKELREHIQNIQAIVEDEKANKKYCDKRKVSAKKYKK